MKRNHLEIEASFPEIKKKINIELGYDSDLLLNEEDEQKLSKMPEIVRESVLEERRTKRNQLI
jgi:hypothetical protein